ncbi:hypothetical protein [Methanosarcina barkeri]|nr:hypothetical protein [Methanosarcina barkeri]
MAPSVSITVAGPLLVTSIEHLHSQPGFVRRIQNPAFFSFPGSSISTAEC